MHSVQSEPAWEFNTHNFRVAFYAEPCEDDPADSFEFPEDIEGVRSGRYEWFNAHVVVFFDGEEVARDVLCCCAYNSVREFFTSHRDRDPANRNTLALKAKNIAICHYFPGMVAGALAEARNTLKANRDKLNGLYLRAA